MGFNAVPTPIRSNWVPLLCMLATAGVIMTTFWCMQDNCTALHVVVARWALEGTFGEIAPFTQRGIERLSAGWECA